MSQFYHQNMVYQNVPLQHPYPHYIPYIDQYNIPLLQTPLIVSFKQFVIDPPILYKKESKQFLKHPPTNKEISHKPIKSTKLMEKEDLPSKKSPNKLVELSEKSKPNLVEKKPLLQRKLTRINRTNYNYEDEIYYKSNPKRAAWIIGRGGRNIKKYIEEAKYLFKGFYNINVVDDNGIIYISGTTEDGVKLIKMKLISKIDEGQYLYFR